MERELKHRILEGLPLGLFEPPAEQGVPTSGWCQIALEGSWDGHHMGAFSLTPRMFDEMVQHFRASKVDIPADYEHAMFWGPMIGSKAPASGWLKSMEVRGDSGSKQLWAEIEWTATAAKHIRDGEYRYLSPVVVFHTKDRKSGRLGGASIHSVALTNTPFLEELPDVRLNSLPAFDLLAGDDSQTEEELMNEEQMRALAALLGLAESATADEIVAAAGGSASLASTGASMLEALELSADIPQADAVAKVMELRNPANDPAEVAALRNRVQELETSQAQRDADEMVAAALQAGKLTAPGTDQHSWACEFARTSPDAFKAWMAAAPQVVPNSTVKRPTDAPSPGISVLTKDTMAEAKRLGLSEDEVKQFAEYAGLSR